MPPQIFFFNFAGARARYFGSDKFLDSIRFIVRSHLSGCVRCTCTSGRNIATGKYIRSTDEYSRNGKNCRIRETVSCHVFDYGDRFYGESGLGITPSRRDGPAWRGRPLVSAVTACDRQRREEIELPVIPSSLFLILTNLVVNDKKTSYEMVNQQRD